VYGAGRRDGTTGGVRNSGKLNLSITYRREIRTRRVKIFSLLALSETKNTKFLTVNSIFGDVSRSIRHDVERLSLRKIDLRK